MSIDVSQFHQVFFEESFEWLDAMEAALLDMEEGVPDVETINTIFRAAHSIKGGAGTFGFIRVSDFTHHLETLLDEIRNGRRTFTVKARSVCLQSVDVLREMLQAVQYGTPLNEAGISDVVESLHGILTNSELPLPSSPETEALPGEAAATGWRILFAPYEQMLQTGNDPLRIFSELSELGQLDVELDCSRVPPLEKLDPELCYLRWSIVLTSQATRSDVAEIFEWVEGDCELSIEPVDPPEDKTVPAVFVPGAPDAPTDSGVAGTAAEAGAEQKNTVVERQLASIRVGTDKVDSLLNLVGELVITQSMLSQIGSDFTEEQRPQLLEGLKQLERNTRDLQEGIMRIRMIPISATFRRFPRLVHDLGEKLGKKVELKLSGEQTELDKTVMEKIGDPLVHLIRNALDHGLELPRDRIAAGKPETGTLQLSAYHQGGNIVIDLIDDGAGLNEERILQKAIEKGLVAESAHLSSEKIHDLIFQPGFSTADVISDVSGRGVGMDVVKKNIQHLGGSIDVGSSPGQGTHFSIRLPLTLAIMDGQIIQIGGQRYIIPLLSIVESVELRSTAVKSVAGMGQVYKFRDEYIPLINLCEIFDLEQNPGQESIGNGLLVVVESEKSKVGLLVDDLLHQQQIVIKSLETHYRNVTGLAGATILGDGQVALILDVAGLTTLYKGSAGDSGSDFQAA